MAGKSEREARESRLASGWIVEGEPAVDAEGPVADGPAEVEAGDETVDGAPSRPQLGSAALILLGVLGGLYLLYVWVWFSWASYYSSVNAAIAEASGVVGSVMQQIVFWAAPLAPILWFVSVLALNRSGRLRPLVLWLLIGAVVLVPLPMFDFGAAS